jgi:hypothetical protein
MLCDQEQHPVTRTHRSGKKLHARIGNTAVAFPGIAFLAGRDQVLPSRRTASGTRDDVVHRHLSTLGPAILARVPVASEDVSAIAGQRCVGHKDLLLQADNDRQRKIFRQQSCLAVLYNLCSASANQ